VIQDHQIQRVGGGDCDSLPGIGGIKHFVEPLLAQNFSDQMLNASIIFNDHCCSHGAALAQNAPAERALVRPHE